MVSDAIVCPHCPPCPGCPQLHFSENEILKKKKEQVAEAFSLFPALRGVTVKPCVPASVQTGYRTRVKFAVGRLQKGSVSIGLFLPATHEVIDLPQCRVVSPELLPIVASLRRLIPETGAGVAHLDLRWSLYQQRAHVILVAPRGSDKKALDRLAAALIRARTEVAGVGVRFAAAGPVLRALSGTTEMLAGEQFLIEKIGQWLFRLSPGSFFQASPAGALLLHDMVRAWCIPLQPVHHLVDLFAGVGMFSVTLSGIARRTTAVESVAAAAADAQASARLSGVSLEVRAASAEKSIKVLPQLKPDIVILDPPRRGADLSVLEAVCAAQPRRIAYVSCDPETLARDLAVLLAGGYRAQQATPVDLFPLTGHVETIALLEKTSAPAKPRILYRDEHYLVAEKPGPLSEYPAPAGHFEKVYDLAAGATGIVVLSAKRDMLPVQFEYLALVKGIPHRQGNLPRISPGKKEKRILQNRYRLLTVIGGYALVRIYTDSTGHARLQQQMHLIGHPILGERHFGNKRTNRFLAETCALHRLFLHLHRITLSVPGNKTIRVFSPLPSDLRLVMRRLKRIRRIGETAVDA